MQNYILRSIIEEQLACYFLLNSVYLIQTTYLGALFLTALGFILIFTGIIIQSGGLNGSDISNAVSLEFSGTFIAGLFWVSKDRWSVDHKEIIYILYYYNITAQIIIILHLYSTLSHVRHNNIMSRIFTGVSVLHFSLL